MQDCVTSALNNLHWLHICFQAVPVLSCYTKCLMFSCISIIVVLVCLKAYVLSRLPWISEWILWVAFIVCFYWHWFCFSLIDYFKIHFNCEPPQAGLARWHINLLNKWSSNILDSVQLFYHIFMYFYSFAALLPVGFQLVYISAVVHPFDILSFI